MGVTDTDAPADEAVSPEEQAGLDREALMRKLRAWFRADRDASSEWRKEAKVDFDFVASHQWDERDLAVLKEQGRPPITFPTSSVHTRVSPAPLSSSAMRLPLSPSENDGAGISESSI